MLNMVYAYDSSPILGDGIFTNNKDLVLGISCRDCMGIIICGINFCGVVHISWKNLYLGIIDKIFKIFEREAVHTPHLKFIVTPHITKEHMQVNFKHMWNTHAYNAYGLQECFSSRNNIEYFSMLKLFENVLQRKYNIPCSHIKCIPIDTVENTNFASYRRDGINNTLTNKILVQIS